MWKRITYPFLAFLMGGVSAFALDPPSLPPRTPIVLEPTTPIRFGNFTAPSGSSGSVTISTNGTPTPGGDVILFGGTTQPAQFEFRLMPGRTVYIRFPSSVTVGGNSAGGSMQFVNPTFELEGGTILEQTSTYISFKSHVGSNKIHRLKMGGTLIVNDRLSNPADTYNSNLPIIIEAY